MKQPTSAIVFGVLGIIFGALGLLGSAFSLFVLQLDDPEMDPLLSMIENPDLYLGWIQFNQILGALFAGVLLVSGIGLLLVREWARRLSVGYAVFTIAFGFLAMAVNWFFFLRPMFGQAMASDDPGLIGGVVGGIAGSLIGLIYPAVLLFFMSRPGVRAIFRAWPDPPEPEPPYAPPPGAASAAVVIDGENPYAPPAAPVGDLPGAAPRGDELVSKLVPTKNKPALIGYYFGLFGLLGAVPLLGVLGIVLAAVAVPSGIKGLRRVRKDPQVRGKVHAWVGIICGAIGGGIGLLVHGLIFWAMLSG